MLYTSSLKGKCKNEARGQKQVSGITKCPMWNGKRVEGTERVSDVYYVVCEADSVLRVG